MSIVAVVASFYDVRNSEYDLRKECGRGADVELKEKKRNQRPSPTWMRVRRDYSKCLDTEEKRGGREQILIVEEDIQ